LTGEFFDIMLIT